MWKTSSQPAILSVLKTGQSSHVPFWFMRQAGRYLPEYRDLRKSFPDFLSFCYNPDAATEATLQPIRRFDMDAAILFSDILVIPDALGQSVRYVEGQGPLLEALSNGDEIEKLDESRVIDHLQPVFKAVSQIRKELAPDKALIGFAGSPWTVACYMIEGKGSKDFAVVRAFSYTHRNDFQKLMDKLVRATIAYLSQQIQSGADMVQLFDSWSGVLPEAEFNQWVIEPTRKIVAEIKRLHPDTPIIGFARGAGVKLASYAKETGVSALGIDTSMPLKIAREQVGGKIILQGNLDPILLASDKNQAVEQTRQLIKRMKGSPYIFNLGHGVVPHTPIENVQAVCDTIREFGG